MDTKSFLEEPSRLQLRFSTFEWNLPNGFMGLWALQSLDFQRKHNIFTAKGCLAFLGWYIQTEAYQLKHYPYLAKHFLHHSDVLFNILSKNILDSSKIHIPLAFYSIYLSRPDLNTLFDLTTPQGFTLFFEWVFMSGYDDYVGQLMCKIISKSGSTFYTQFKQRGYNALNDYTSDLTDFDETWYLSRYPDVENVVLSGKFEQAKDHWLQFGRNEGRIPAPLPMKPVEFDLIICPMV